MHPPRGEMQSQQDNPELLFSTVACVLDTVHLFMPEKIWWKFLKTSDPQCFTPVFKKTQHARKVLV